MVKPILVAVLSFIVFMILHVVRFHFFHPKEKARSVLNTYYLSMVIFTLIYVALPKVEEMKLALIPDELWGFAYGLIILGALFLGYLLFYFTADRSITFRMLMLIEESEKKALTENEMIELYQPNQIITRRFKDMVYGGYMHEDGIFFKQTQKGRSAERIYRFFIDTLRLGKY
jgi:Mn2+/Fe2+ NRAMP family transporter